MNYILLLIGIYVAAHVLGYLLSAATDPFDLSCLEE